MQKRTQVKTAGEIIQSNGKSTFLAEIVNIKRNLQVWAVAEFIKLNEKLIFNNRLLRFYRNNINKKVNRVIDVGANIG